jgi:RNA polymerase sigma-70 factor (ECF subfamily)
VVQETFIRAWQALPKLRSDDAFRSWLYSIALSRSREMLSKQSKRRESSTEFEPGEESSPDRQIASHDDGPEPMVLKAEAKAAVEKALVELSDEHRSVVAMHHLEDMDVSDVARILGIPQGTVLSRLARARAVLRRKLAPYMENY